MSDEKPNTNIDRRRFLTVVGATGAGAVALTGCSTDRVQKLIPYMVGNEDQIPGIATYYASSCTECAAACGLAFRVKDAHKTGRRWSNALSKSWLVRSSRTPDLASSSFRPTPAM